MNAVAIPENAALAKPDVFEIGPEERALLVGDLSALSPEQRASLVVKICESVGLNALTRPFEYIVLNGKLTLYARKDATEQLRRRHTVSLKIVGRENVEGVFVVTARATMPNGRDDESIGAVPINGIKGEALANAIMKAETKAKRRVTLSICGLGMLDELELETIPATQIRHVEVTEPPAQLALNGATQNAVVTLPIDDDDAAELVHLCTVLGFDEARILNGVSWASGKRVTAVAMLNAAEAAKMRAYLKREIDKMPKGEPCAACGATPGAAGTIEDHEYDPQGKPCPEDVSPAADQARAYFAKLAEGAPA